MSEMHQDAPGSVYPGHDQVVVPEFCRQTPLEGLPPGLHIFPYNSSFTVDESSGKIYMRGSGRYDMDDIEPEFMEGRVGLARVYGLVDGEMVDGFVADFRYADPGSLQLVRWTADPTDYSTLSAIQEAKERDKPVPPLAAVFKDPDGNRHDRGDSRLTGFLDELIVATDAAVKRVASTQEREQDLPAERLPVYTGPAHVTAEFLG